MAKKEQTYIVNRRIRHDGKRYAPKDVQAQQPYRLTGGDDFAGSDTIKLDPKSAVAQQLLLSGAISEPDSKPDNDSDGNTDSTGDQQIPLGGDNEGNAQ